MKPKVETNRETGTMKIDDIEFNEKQVKALNHLLEAFEKKITNQVCDVARKKIVEATCYDTEEEVRNVIYDLNASTALEILDEVEKG